MSKTRKISLPIAITGSVLAVIVLAAIVLSFVNISTFAILPKMNHADIFNLSTTNSRLTVTEGSGDEVKYNAFNKAVKGTKFSIIQAVLEGKFDTKAKFVTYKDEDKKKQFKELSATEVKEIKATATEYMIEFVYSKTETLKVEGKDIEFDRIKVLVGDSSGEIGKMIIYPYLYDRIDNAHEGDTASEFYVVRPVKIYANSSKLFSTLKELFK